MTSPSRRKLRTTRPSTRRPRIRDGAAGLLALLALTGAALAQAAGPEIAPRSPLDRLRDRSARQRWETMRDAYAEEDVPKTAPRGVLPTAGTERAAQLPPTETPPRSTGRVIEDPFEAVPESPPASAPVPTTGEPGYDERPDDVESPLAAPETIEIGEPEDAPPAETTSTVIEPIPEPPPETLPEPDPRAGSPDDSPDDAEQPYGRRLLRIEEILPYADYEPDPLMAESDPCRHLCPRPDGLDCPPLGLGGEACPDEFDLPVVDSDLRPEFDVVYTWEASNLFHYPLYFDDPQLERYGHAHHPLIQPFDSVGRFGVQLLHLPYKAAIDPWHKRMYTLGWYRPGDPAPKYIELPGWNRDAAIAQGLWTTGMFFLIP